MFRDMKDAVQTLRSDELGELRRKADAQPRMSMLDGVKAANAAYDAAVLGGMADPAAFQGIYLSGTQGTASLNAISDTGTMVGNAPVCELDLTVTLPGKGPYSVKHRQLIAHSALARFQPGATFSVRVDANDPSKLVIGS